MASTEQKMKFSIRNSFSKCYQIRSFLYFVKANKFIFSVYLAEFNNPENSSTAVCFATYYPKCFQQFGVYEID